MGDAAPADGAAPAPAPAPAATTAKPSGAAALEAFSPVVAFAAVAYYVMNFVWISWRRAGKDGTA